MRVAGTNGEYHPVDLTTLLPFPGEAPVSYVDFRDTPRPTTAEAWNILEADMVRRVKEITVDLDAGTTIDPDLRNVLRRLPPHTTYSRVSNDGQGRHLRIVLDSACTAWQALQLRVTLGDDANRVAFDLYRAASGHPEDAGGWLADGKAYWDVKAKTERWGTAGEWIVTPELLP